MLFTTFSFVFFLLVVLTLFYVLPKPFRRYLLLAASLFFYMAWRAKFVVLILGLITVDYFAALWISRRAGAQRRMALIVSLAANVGMLGWFKYANFARETWIHLLHPVLYHKAAIRPLDIILPLGISFHTFQSISYVIDVYRGEQAVVTSYIDYALFVSFFPQLVAGPIVRAREFFRDLWNWKAPTAAEWQEGVALILTGFVKKLVFADQFALVADKYFGVFREPGGAAWNRARVDRYHRVRAADFFRFLGLYRYRHRGRSAFRFPLPRELSPAIPLGKHY
jgi:alginate O-acetyltransferase complex protein AlgI